MSYAFESQELDRELIDVVRAWHETGTALSDAAFNDLSLRIFSFQLRYNVPYARYCAARGITGDQLPASWETIPAVPAASYKEATLATFDPKHAARIFHTSGTTQSTAGKHYMETSDLYDAGLLATFDRLVLQPFGAASTSPEMPPKFRYLNLLADPEQSAATAHSSLSYMMWHIVRERGNGAKWFIRNGNLDISDFIASVEDTATVESTKTFDRGFAGNYDGSTPFFITGTAFAFVEICDKLRAGKRSLHLPPGSVIMETGGFKGRTRTVQREELYGTISELLNVPQNRIFSEYGMTELTSQYYDDVSLLRDSVFPKTSLGGPSLSETPLSNIRIKKGPPWLRTRVIGVNGVSLPERTIGALVHVDLLNRSSCIAIQTEDLGTRVNGGIILLGREESAALRGCSLDAEHLRVC